MSRLWLSLISLNVVETSLRICRRGHTTIAIARKLSPLCHSPFSYLFNVFGTDAQLFGQNHWLLTGRHRATLGRSQSQQDFDHSDSRQIDHPRPTPTPQPWNQIFIFILFCQWKVTCSSARNVNCRGFHMLISSRLIRSSVSALHKSKCYGKFGSESPFFFYRRPFSNVHIWRKKNNPNTSARPEPQGRFAGYLPLHYRPVCRGGVTGISARSDLASISVGSPHVAVGTTGRLAWPARGPCGAYSSLTHFFTDAKWLY